jgi:hypothetical protein
MPRESGLTVHRDKRRFGTESRGNGESSRLSGLPPFATRGTVLRANRCTDTIMVEKKKPPKRRPKYAVDDRRQFLTMMSPKTIRAIKLAALDRNEPAWVIMEEAAEEWLERHKRKPT